MGWRYALLKNVYFFGGNGEVGEWESRDGMRNLKRKVVLGEQ